MNANAVKHGGWSDSLKHFHRLVGEAREYADELVDGFVDEFILVHQVPEAEVREDDELMDDLRRLAAMHHQWMAANVPVFRDGVIVEREREEELENGETVTWTEGVLNPAEKAMWRISGRERTLREKHGIELATITAAQKRQQELEEIGEAVRKMD